MISKARMKEIKEDARLMEASCSFAKTIEEEAGPEMLKLLDELGNRFLRGRYFLHYRKNFGEGPFDHLLKFRMISEEEAEEAIAFAYFCMKLKCGRRKKVQEATHLRLVK